MFDVSGPRPSDSSRSRFSGRDRHEQRLLVRQVVDLRHAVILEAVADRQRRPHFDPQRRQLVLGTDPGQHQQHRRVVRAGGKDHLALGSDLLDVVAARDLDTDRPLALEQDPERHRVGDHVEVLPVIGGVQERAGGAAPQPITLGQLEAPDTLLARAVEVGIVLVSGLARRFEHRLDERVHRAAVGHPQRAADAVVPVLAALVVLGAPEVRQDFVIAPALAARRGPAVVVGPVAADVDHRVDRAATPEHAAAREVQAPVAEARFGLAQEIPVEARLEQRRERDRHVDLRLAVRPSGLEQGDPHVGVLAQAGGQDTAGRPGADDHVVVAVALTHRVSPPSSPRLGCSLRNGARRGPRPARTRG